MTSAAGMPAYEISNYARRGQESRHNLTYWRYGDYAGIGPGAHGRRLGHAHGAPPEAREFPVRAARATATASPRKRRSPPIEAADEALVMGLRLARRDRCRRARRPLRAAGDRRLEPRRPPGRLRPSRARRRAHRADAPAAGCCSITSSAKSPPRSLGLWRLRLAGWQRASTAGVAAGCGLAARSAVGHEFIIVGRRRDIIVDRHLGVVSGSLAVMPFFMSERDQRRPSAIPSGPCRRCADRPRCASPRDLLARRLGRRFMQAAAERVGRRGDRRLKRRQIDRRGSQ